MAASMISFKCSDRLKNELDSLAGANGVSRSTMIKIILEQGVIVQKATFELIHSDEGKQFIREVVDMNQDKSIKPVEPKIAKKKKTKKRPRRK